MGAYRITNALRARIPLPISTTTLALSVENPLATLLSSAFLLLRPRCVATRGLEAPLINCPAESGPRRAPAGAGEVRRALRGLGQKRVRTRERERERDKLAGENQSLARTKIYDDDVAVIEGHKKQAGFV